MEIREIIDFIWSLATFRNVALAVCCLPLLTMAAALLIFRYLSVGVREGIIVFGVFGLIGNSVLAIESGYRSFAEVMTYLTQKPQYFFDVKVPGMVKVYDPFDYVPLVYLTVFAGISILHWILIDLCSTIKKNGQWGKKYSEESPLGLNNK